MNRRHILTGAAAMAVAALLPSRASFATPPIAQTVISHIKAAGWSCSINVSRGRFINLVWSSTDTAPAKWLGQDIHMGVDTKHDGADADEIFADLTEYMKYGPDEDADGWRTSFDPVTGKFYRNNVYGEVA